MRLVVAFHCMACNVVIFPLAAYADSRHVLLLLLLLLLLLQFTG
jgi:hypothetical protein